MKKLLIRVPLAYHRALQELAKRTGSSVSELVRQGVRLLLKQERK